MLCNADAALVARDPALPGLVLLLDAKRMHDVLAALAPHEDIAAVVPTYLRYKRGTSCVAGFRVQRGGGAALELYAKAFDAANYGIVRARPKWPAGEASFAFAPHYVDAQQVVLLGMQHDTKLKALRQLADPASAARLIGRLLHERDAAPAQLEPLRYKAERRFVGRLARGGDAFAVLRVHAAPRFSAALVGATLGAAVGGAALLGANAQARVLALRWLAGRTLCPQSGTPPDARAMRRIGQALACVHASGLQHPEHRSRTAEADAVLRAVEALAEVCPPLAERARGLAARVIGALAETPFAARLVHGDFSADQAVDDGDAMRIIDWDHAACGDAAADLGSFCARLEMQAIDGSIERRDADAAMQAFRDGYASAGRAPRAVELQTAAALLRLAPEPFRNRVGDWPERANALLDRAQEIVRAVHRAPTAGGGAEVQPAPTTGAGADACRVPPARSDGDPCRDLPLLSVALDAAAMRPIIARCIGQASNALQVRGARLVRHKPGRRWLVEYHIEPRPRGGHFALLGKGRAKGLDRTGFEVQRALWRNGFSAAGTARVAVPEPLEAIPELHLWLQRKVAGTPASALFTPDAGPALARRVAEALAKLHHADIDSARRWTLADEVDMLRQRLRAAAALLPTMAQRIDHLADACARLAARMPAPTVAGIHRDFHPDQLLVDGERLYLLDLDLYCIGDPALDAGNFVAHLIEQALRLHGDAAALAHHTQALELRFLELSRGVAAPALQGYTTLALARHVFLSTQFDDRRHTSGQVLDLCKVRLDGVA